MSIRVKVSKTDPRAILPHGPDAFYLSAIVEHDCFLPPGGKYLFGTGLAFDIPEGWEGQVWPCDEVSRKNGVVCSLRIVPSQYKEEVFVCLYNNSYSTFRVKSGDCVAQIVFKQAPQVTLHLVDKL